ncbi:MAG TPA: hypothetical protein VHG72_21785 [Polyangia bacterium]|nr:hypothetical protein [Polyangia bacterium]
MGSIGIGCHGGGHAGFVGSWMQLGVGPQLGGGLVSEAHPEMAKAMPQSAKTIPRIDFTQPSWRERPDR